MNYLPYNGQNGTCSSKSNRKDFEYNFLIICRYLKLVKKCKDNLRANIEITGCSNIKILYRLWKSICYFHMNFA